MWLIFLSVMLLCSQGATFSALDLDVFNSINAIRTDPSIALAVIQDEIDTKIFNNVGTYYICTNKPSFNASNGDGLM